MMQNHFLSRRRRLGRAVVGRAVVGRAVFCMAVFCMAVFCMAVATGPLMADAPKNFRNGLLALEDSRLADAEQLFRSAIKERDEERAGGLRRLYIPHFYLGVTLAGQGRCREAIEAWEKSESQGQIQKVQKEGAEISGRKQRCIDALRSLDQARLAAEQALAQARKSEQTLARIRAEEDLQAVWAEGPSSLAERATEALASLADAAARLAAVGDLLDTRPYEKIRSIADQAAIDLDQLTADAQVRLEEIRSAESSALERLETAERAGHAELTKVKKLEPFPPVLGQQVNALHQVLAQAAENKSSASSDQLNDLREAIGYAVAELRRGGAGPPQSLRRAVGAFLGGSYAEVLTALDGKTFRSTRASGQACLLQSASRHALYVLGGEQDIEMANLLYQEVVDCRQLKPSAEISTTFFSPRFVRYYENPMEPEPIQESKSGSESDLNTEAESAVETGESS